MTGVSCTLVPDTPTTSMQSRENHVSLSNLNIGARLSLCFAALLLLILAVAATGWSALRNTEVQSREIVLENNVKIAHANAMQRHLNVMMRAVRDIILFPDPVVHRQQKERIAAARSGYDDRFTALGAQLHLEAGKKIHADLAAHRTATAPQFDRVIALAEAGKGGEGLELLRDTVQGMQNKWLDSLQQMIAQQEQLNASAIARMTAEHAAAVKALGGVALAAVLLGAFLAWQVTRGITRPLALAERAARHIAAGDLTVAVAANSSGETGRLLTALNDMQQGLRNTVATIEQSSQAVGAAAREIAQGNQDLASRTEEQASALEQTAAAMAQMTVTVRQSADSAKLANDLALNAIELASKGGAAVERVAGTMSAISRSAKQIADITGVIDGIAFQTNILALNAAVEAARAGEQGRGFAVVASEVRSLAQRSAAAAKQIKDLASASAATVKEGNLQVGEAGQTMSEIVVGIQQAGQIVEELAAASREQAQGIGQVSGTVSQMEKMTQQNAAMVEQAGAAAAQLDELAAQLEQAVAAFKTGTHA